MQKKFSLLDYYSLIFIAYLVIVYFSRTMKVSLAILIVCALLPSVHLLSFTRKNWILLFIFLTYFVVGVLFQNPYETFVVFFGKYFQFLSVYLIVNLPNLSYGTKNKVLESPLTYSLFMAVEFVLCLFLYIRGDLIDENSFSRLTAGSQPIGGNISIACLPFLYSLYFEKGYRLLCVVFSFVSFIVIVLSGTRGYMLCYSLSVLPLYCDYFLSKKSTGKNSRALLVLFVLLIVPLLILFRNPSDDAKYLRAEQGLGSRSLENTIAIDFFLNTSISHKLFGVGFGCTLSENPVYNNVAWNNIDIITDWSYDKYIDAKGAPFHNFFANILLTQGILGYVVCFILFFSVLFYICKLNFSKTYEKYCFIMYWVSFWGMNIFRWTTDCGIIEMLILGITLRMIHVSANNEQSNKGIVSYHPSSIWNNRQSLFQTELEY